MSIVPRLMVRAAGFATLAACAAVTLGCGNSAEPPQFTLYFTVSGLRGTLILQDGGVQKSITANGWSSFPTMARGSTYRVIVLTQPAGQTCSVANGVGTMRSDILDVSITCGPAAKLNTLYSFDGILGLNPGHDFVRGNDGNFYGETDSGPPSRSPRRSATPASVFMITPNGFVTVVHAFGSGIHPAGLAQGSDGNLYGTTFGYYKTNPGTVFKLTLGGDFTQLYEFSGSDGSSPFAGVVQGRDGDLYGTTTRGGAGDGGTVFKLTPDGELTTIHSFVLGDNVGGFTPTAALVQGSDGNLYGTTSMGGGGAQFGGILFRISPEGMLTPLHAFYVPPSKDAVLVVPSVSVEDDDGNLYGTTTGGGDENVGSIFRVTSAGELTTLYSFSGPDGALPSGSLIEGSDGNFYGTTGSGGAKGEGTVFKLTPGGVLTTLYSFSGSDGAMPFTGVAQGSDGNLYGTTNRGGKHNLGTVFKLAVH